ncbi:MAG TPA: pilin [Candidatus Woesebacteria bacterium]|nr:pilin [Candidatus Woesebacteria bacterium]
MKKLIIFSSLILISFFSSSQVKAEVCPVDPGILVGQGACTCTIQGSTNITGRCFFDNVTSRGPYTQSQGEQDCRQNYGTRQLCYTEVPTPTLNILSGTPTPTPPPIQGGSQTSTTTNTVNTNTNQVIDVANTPLFGMEGYKFETYGESCGVSNADPNDPRKQCCVNKLGTMVVNAPNNFFGDVISVLPNSINFLSNKFNDLSAFFELKTYDLSADFGTTNIVNPYCSGGIPSSIAEGKNIYTDNACICNTQNEENLLRPSLCKTVPQAEASACTECVQPPQGSNYEGRPGVWTGIGCVRTNFSDFITDTIFRTGLGIAGLIALGCIIYASFLMQTSQGNPEQIQKAQEMITSCITGLIMIIFSVFILRVIGVDILRIPGFSANSQISISDAPVQSTISNNSPIPTIKSSTSIISQNGAILPGAVLYQEGGAIVPLDAGVEVKLLAISSNNLFIKVNTPSARIGWLRVDKLLYDSNVNLPNEEIPQNIFNAILTSNSTIIESNTLVPTSTPIITTLPTVISIPTPTSEPLRNLSLGIYDCDPNIGPLSNEVYFYDKLNYSGACLRLSEGNYPNLNNISNNAVDYWNIWSFGTCDNNNFEDCIASLKVGSAVRANLYNGRNFTNEHVSLPKGEYYDIRTRHSQLLDNISSIKIEKQ